ncbi:LTA synthase family protein [Bianquea renquensis]|uniref:LTA synthase family protein n=1 Tax=Bianquea renquensis TaxID=2763661 RepID=A0A926DR24_9FIRM|nr:LTA synthase family protein [Bianquea renquensis]MBC8543640.1 LTA synthase family protein [Bianquea renquensis]
MKGKTFTILIGALLVCMFIFKFIVFYTTAGISMISFSFPFSLLFFGMVMYLIFSNRRWSIRKKWGWYLAWNVLVSALMFIDLYYNSYFDQFPVIALLGQLSMLDHLQKTMAKMFNIAFVVILMDLPVLVVLTVKKVPFSIPKCVVARVGTVAIMAVYLLTVVLPTTPVDMVTALQRSEIFSFHGHDVRNFLTGYNSVQALEALAENGDTKESMSEVSKSQYHGLAKGRNLIVVQLESFQNFLIGASYEGQVITPNLNRLLQEDTLYFDHYYQQIGKGSTSDAEFASQNSFLPVMYGQSYTRFMDNAFYGLPWIMRENGYSATAFHGYVGEFWNRDEAYPQQGFEDFYSAEDFVVNDDNTVGWGLGDESFFRQSVSVMKSLPKPFYSFLITLTSHNPYDITDRYEGIQLRPEQEDTLFGNYLNAVHYTDAAIGTFLSQLKQEGLYDNSIIVFYGDHFGLKATDEENQEQMSAFLGHTYDYDEMFNIPLIVHIPGSGVSETISTAGGQIDFMPTIVDLMGYNDSVRVALGKNILTQEEGFVVSQAYMLKGSFITDDIAFEISKDGIFEHSRAWDLHTREAIEDIEPFREQYEKALQFVDLSTAMLEQNYMQFTCNVPVERLPVNGVRGLMERAGSSGSDLGDYEDLP